MSMKKMGGKMMEEKYFTIYLKNNIAVSECLIWWLLLQCCVCNLLTLSAQMEWFYDHWMFAVFLFAIPLSLQYFPFHSYCSLLCCVLLFFCFLFLTLISRSMCAAVFILYLRLNIMCDYSFSNRNNRKDEENEAELLTSTVCDYI